MKCAAGRATRALQWTVFLLLVGFVQNGALADVTIRWSAPAECPGRDELALRVERLVGGSVPASIAAITKVTRSADGYRASVRIDNATGSGERMLEEPSCELLLDSVALVIALSTLSSGAPQHKSERRVDVLAAGYASAWYGPLPQPALGVGGALAVDIPASLRFELRAAYYVKQSITFESSTLGADFRMLGFGARGCRLVRLGALELAPCLGAELHQISARGFGGMSERSGVALSWGPAMGIFGRLRLLKALALYVAVEGVVPLTRRRFVFADVGELHRPTAVSVQLLLAPEVRF